MKVLADHHNPTPSEIVQHYKFHTRGTEPGETEATYVSKLRSLVQECKFGNSFNDMIHNHLVCGVNSDAIQRRLLAEPKLDYKKALEIAIGVETASKNLLELSRPGSAGQPQGCREIRGINKVMEGAGESIQ